LRQADGAHRSDYNPRMERIYLDHNATTPVDPRVLDVMVSVLRSGGNPSSLHSFGQAARATIEDARRDVAALIAATPAEVVFTGSGTEADNMAILGLAAMAQPSRPKVVFSAIEHHAVVAAAKVLGESGIQVETVRVGQDGIVDLDDLRALVDERTALVAVMLANNETGMVQPVADVVEIARRKGALVHCDGVQAAGKIPVDVGALGVDTLALSAHKFYGPQGVGALYVKRGTRMKALLHGGPQERNRRAGTENVAGIAGMGCAARLAAAEIATEGPRLERLRDALEGRLLALPGAERNGSGPRIPNTTNISFEDAEAESLLMALDLAGIAVSTGAACAAGAVSSSHVLRGMHLPARRVQGSLRFSLGHSTKDADVARAAEALAEILERHRAVAHSRR
jgi:cysteine desulfurase